MSNTISADEIGSIERPVPKPGSHTRPSDAIANPEWIYVDGSMVARADATIHVSSVAARYGTSVFEGMCVYGGDSGQSFIFRAKEHLTRLRQSLRIMEIDCGYSDADFMDAILRSVRENQIRSDAHVRLSVFVVGEGLSECRGPISLVCVAHPRPATPIGQRGSHVNVSTWRRVDDSVMPMRIKAGANYQNSRFGTMEARRNGYDEAIFLTTAGKVSEGGHSCFAMVRNGVLITPPVTASILESVTRLTLLELAADDLDLRVQEREIDRSELYIADEAFFCGSRKEICPVLSVDRFPVGDGRVGPMTRHLWDAYQAVVRGRNKTRAGWLTPVWQDAKS
jgi:branched-chain amino acid aminotransferase